MNYSLKTNQGKRKDNQDYTQTFFNQSNLLLAVLCDGLGGHQAGDIASEMAVSQIGNAWEATDFTMSDTYIVQQWLNKKINEENTRIFEAASTYSDLEGMGTTLVACVVLEEQLLFANVGDSRAYTYFDGSIQLMTEDHSFVSELQRKGELTDLEAMNHFNKNALTRSLGVDGRVEVDFFKTSKHSTDLVLLNSDGLSNVVGEEDMVKILAADTPLDKKAENLIKTAIDHDASDNITVNLIDVQSDVQLEAGENE
jgi:protein phosphatase